MQIRIATSDSEIADCYSVMRELRPGLVEDRFVARIRSQEKSGYRLAYVLEPMGVVAVAGFRMGENLAWGRYVYVDDLVTHPGHRSKGHGSRLLAWLRDLAVSEGCEQVHLDSGVQRQHAHRFYEREGMTAAGLHFVQRIAPDKPVQSDGGDGIGAPEC